MDSQELEPEDLKHIFDKTDIVRKPLTGIIQDHHHLPYTLIGPNTQDQKGSIRLQGAIHVSPRMVLSIDSLPMKFQEIFAEEEPFMDQSLVHRTFSFNTTHVKNMNIRNDSLEVDMLGTPAKELMSHTLEEFAQKETINRGLIWSPNPRFYPVSLEKFIFSILDEEMR
jgi:hypothetical protein